MQKTNLPNTRIDEPLAIYQQIQSLHETVVFSSVRGTIATAEKNVSDEKKGTADTNTNVAAEGPRFMALW